jgi:hypothetical protein
MFHSIRPLSVPSSSLAETIAENCNGLMPARLIFAKPAARNGRPERLVCYPALPKLDWSEVVEAGGLNALDS